MTYIAKPRLHHPTLPKNALGLVFVSRRPAEIDQQHIPQILGNMAVKMLDHLGTGGVIG